MRLVRGSNTTMTIAEMASFLNLPIRKVSQVVLGFNVNDKDGRRVIKCALSHGWLIK